MGQPAYFQVLTNDASGVAADFANANEVLMTTATGLLGFQSFSSSVSRAANRKQCRPRLTELAIRFSMFSSLGHGSYL